MIFHTSYVRLQELFLRVENKFNSLKWAQDAIARNKTKNRAAINK